MSMKLRDLIRKVRQCKTAAEERAVIAKESAMIRTAIREEQVHYRHRNVAKLLFMHMLGYPTHFGQLECMKLTASPHFPEKRIGYLGMLLLLSEEAEVLMLATNALKSDLTSDNKFVSGLALCAIGNLATADMSRDLAPEVDKHLKSNMAYLRKKACLAMARCLTKCPDMVEDFVDRVTTLLKDKSHGVLITVVQLMTQVLMIDYRNAEEEEEDPYQTQCRKAFLKLVPTLVKMLRNLLGTGYSMDLDVGGIADPFLQVQLLTLLRLLGTNNVKASEEMNDVLAQVATNTETAKNAGNAILYECVQTIMGIESEDGLRVLAVNILGRFLLNRDNNIRYVALNTLAKCIMDQKEAGRESELIADGEAKNAMTTLQRHRTTVVDCLKDPDISIRQRALELIYHLVNESNVKSLTAELLNYLVLCPREHRSDICNRILKVVDRFSPDDRWRVDSLITTLTIAGREASSDVQSAAVIYISRSSADVHAFATHKLLKAIRDDDGSQHGLLAVGVWCIGEYGDLLLRPYTYTAPSQTEEEMATNGDVTITFMELDPSTVVATVQEVTGRHTCPEFVKQRALTTYAKLSSRFADKGDSAALEKLHSILKKNSGSRSLELQLRACEYDALVSAARGLRVSVQKKAEDDIFGVSNGGDSVSSAVISAAKEALVRMPVIDAKILQKRLNNDDGFGEERAARPARPVQAAEKSGGDLLDLNDMFGAPPAQPAPVSANGGTTSNSGGEAGKSDLDLLADIFSAQPTPAPAPAVGTFDMFATPAAPAAAAPPAAAVNPMDLFGVPPASNMQSSLGAMPPPNTMQLGAMPTTQQSMPPMGLMLNPAQTTAPAMGMDIFGSNPTSQAPAPPPSQPSGDIFGSTAPAPAPVAQTNDQTSVRVPAISHAGLSVEFECTKPDLWNKQKSTLLAHFTNTTDTPIYGMSFQVALPKYATMEMEPPSSTTIPVSGGPAKAVTQKVTVVNSMLGTKNLALKLKLGFTLKGQKLEHMATCSGFPAGEY